MIDRQTASGLRRPGMSALRIVTGMTVDESRGPGAVAQHLAPRASRSGESSV
jgi:hypothetical protein